MNKLEIYPKVIVYKNMLPRWKEYTDLLKQSEDKSPEGLFTEWQDWYGFGKMMNLSMNRAETEYSVEISNEYTKLQKDFLTDVTKAYYEFTEDYVKTNDI